MVQLLRPPPPPPPRSPLQRRFGRGVSVPGRHRLLRRLRRWAGGATAQRARRAAAGRVGGPRRGEGARRLPAARAACAALCATCMQAFPLLAQPLLLAAAAGAALAPRLHRCCTSALPHPPGRPQAGLFRYDVTACPTKLVPGAYGFIAQCNEGRLSKKRPTEFRIDQVRAWGGARRPRRRAALCCAPQRSDRPAGPGPDA